MNKTMLITRPKHDNLTYYLNVWMGEAKTFAEKQGITVIDLEGENANKIKFESYVTKGPNINFIVFNGHGNEETVTGHNNEDIVHAGVNEKLLANKIIYSISCASAKILGLKSVENGAVTYIGYNNDFYLYYEDTETKPLNDDLARLFLQHAIDLIEYIIKGNSTGTAFEKAKKTLKDSILATTTSGYFSQYIIAALWHDYTSFIIQGEKNALL
jgi:hypothetical protein